MFIFAPHVFTVFIFVPVGPSDPKIGPAKVMKAVGAQVADRDNGVRSAALDVVRSRSVNIVWCMIDCSITRVGLTEFQVVAVHALIGDDVHKLLGPLPDMCVDLINERIKRTGKKPDGAPSAAPAPTAAAAAAPTGMLRRHDLAQLTVKLPRRPRPRRRRWRASSGWTWTGWIRTAWSI